MPTFGIFESFTRAGFSNLAGSRVWNLENIQNIFVCLESFSGHFKMTFFSTPNGEFSTVVKFQTISKFPILKSEIFYC